ncbi:MAG TPA: hypothetical protein VFS42_00965 [Burkholderiaceae bacterium]|nr:hypothetical protein [Burkholderiaceae bacterium]
MVEPRKSESPDAPNPRLPMRHGDEAPAGSQGTAENVCPVCHGSGTLAGKPCVECDGTGRITVGIGGA